MPSVSSRQQGSSTQDRAARYPCPVCPRAFDRRDVLRRHMRIHDRDRAMARSKKRACIPCSRSKIRCQGERPSCSACEKRSVVCEYSSPDSDFHHRQSSPCSTLREDRCSTTVDDGRVSLPPSVGEARSPFRAQLTPGSGDAATAEQLLALNSLPTNFGLSPSSNPDMLPLLQSIDFNSNIDWLLDPQAEMVPMFGEVDCNPGEPFLNVLGGGFPTLDSEQRVLPSYPASPHRQFDMAEPQWPSTSSLPTPNPREDCGPDDPWPMTWYARKINRLRFPPLDMPGGFVHRPSFSPQTYINSSIMAEMQRLVNMCSVDAEDLRLPEMAKLNYCIDLFFAHFNLSTSLLHRPTFDPRASVVVTLTVAAIGILYSNFTRAREFSYTLSEVIRKILLLLEEYDRRFVRSEDHLVAQVLQGFHGYCSGNQRLFELSETSRGSLITNARRMGLFAKEDGAEPPPPTPSSAVRPAWLEWVRKERLRRLAWGIYMYDASVSYLHNVRPIMSISEVNMRLPSSQLEWDAESAESWAAVRQTPGNPHKENLHQMLRSLFDGSEQPQSGIQALAHRATVISTLVRMIWSAKELRGSSIHDLIAGASEDPGRALVPALDLFLESPLVNRDRRTQAQTSSLVRQQSLIHIGHLYAAGDLMNWLYPLLRNRDTDGSLERRMWQWKANHPTQVRDATYHAAQIIGLAQQFAGHGPYQVFAVFHASVVLFYMARILSEASPDSEGLMSTPVLEHLKLDFLGPSHEETAVRIANWVEHGSPAVIGLNGVPNLCCQQGVLQMLEITSDMLGRTQVVWGVAESLRRVVLRLRDAI